MSTEYLYPNTASCCRHYKLSNNRKNKGHDEEEKNPNWYRTLMPLFEYSFIYFSYIPLYYITYEAYFTQDISDMPYCILQNSLFV